MADQANTTQTFDDEANYNDPVVKHTTIGNLEGLKRSFFGIYRSSDVESDQTPEQCKTAFETELLGSSFLFFKASFKNSDEYTGRYEFIARNFNKGLVREFDEFSKYFFNVFRCYCVDTEAKKYDYISYWIVNTTDELKTITDRVDDFTLEPVDKAEFLVNFVKQTNDALISEEYVH
jgi:hypothetical protein